MELFCPCCGLASPSTLPSGGTAGVATAVKDSSPAGSGFNGGCPATSCFAICMFHSFLSYTRKRKHTSACMHTHSEPKHPRQRLHASMARLQLLSQWRVCVVNPDQVEIPWGLVRAERPGCRHKHSPQQTVNVPRRYGHTTIWAMRLHGAPAVTSHLRNERQERAQHRLL